MCILLLNPTDSPWVSNFTSYPGSLGKKTFNLFIDEVEPDAPAAHANETVTPTPTARLPTPL